MFYLFYSREIPNLKRMSITSLHNDMCLAINEQLYLNQIDFQTQCSYLLQANFTNAQIETMDNVLDLVCFLMRKRKIIYGNYTELRKIFQFMTNEKACDIIDGYTSRIERAGTAVPGAA